MSRRSRLSKRLETQTKRNLYLSIGGILAFIIFLIFFGVPLLINFSLFIASTKEKKEDTATQTEKTFLSPPILDSPFSATNSAQIIVTGTAMSKQIISLYVNEELFDKTNTKDNGTFAFQNVRLNKGLNTIKAKTAKDDKNESSFSDTLSVTYADKAPTLSVDSPAENQTFKKDDKTISVSGKTDPGIRVTVNDFIAIVDSEGKYSYTLTLKDGDNQIAVVATDDAGNKTENQRKVTYNP